MDKITEELVNENIALSKEVQRLKAVDNKAEDITCSFSIVELANKPVTIRGVLLAEGIWKGVKFSYEKFKKIANMFVGIPLLKDHGHTKEYGNFKGGSVKRVIPNDNLRCLEFEAEVSSEDFANLIKSGQVDAVSPKANWKVNDALSPPEMEDCNEAIELSLTNSPVCTFCSIFNMEMSMFKENLNIETDNDVDMKDHRGDVILSEHKDESTDKSAEIKKLIADEIAKINAGVSKEDVLKAINENKQEIPKIDEAAFLAKARAEAKAEIEAKGYIAKADYDTAIAELQGKIKTVDEEALVAKAVAAITPKPAPTRPDAAIPRGELHVAAADLILGKGLDAKYNKKEGGA